MAKLRVAFFKASSGELDDKLIDLVTGNDGFSHCELMFSIKHTIAAHYLNGGVIECYYNNLSSDPRWVILEKEVSGYYKSSTLNLAKSFLGQGYDTKGVVCTALLNRPICIDKNSTWCSKLIARCMIDQIDKDINIMPNDLYKALLYSGWRIVDKTLQSKNNKSDKELDRFGRIGIKYD
jgi:hypothetical protein